MSITTTMPNDAISERVMSRAESENRYHLKKKLERIHDPKIFYTFIGKNAADIIAIYDMTARDLDKKLALSKENLDSGDQKRIADELKILRDMALDYVRRSGSVSNIDTSMLPHMQVTKPAELQRRVNRHYAMNAAALSSGLKIFKSFGVALRTASALPFMAAHLLGGTAKAAAHVTVVPLAHTWVAFANAMHWSTLKRHIILSTFTAAAAGATVAPMNAAPYANLFTQGQTVDAPNCAPGAVYPNGPLTSAFSNLQVDAVHSFHQAAAMRGVHYGIAPIAMYIISMMETSDAHDVRGAGSSANGLFQTTTPTKLDFLKNYGQQTPFYTQARERLASGQEYAGRTEDVLNITAINTVINDYTAHHERTLNAVQAGTINAAYDRAFALADQTSLGGDLMAAKMADDMPYLSIANLEGKTGPEILTLVSQAYRPHFFGDAGARFFNYVLENRPDIRMNDAASMGSLYRAYNPGSSAETIDRYDTYFASIVGGNHQVFPQGDGMTAAQVRTSIERFAATFGNEAIEDTFAVRTQTAGAIADCETSRAALMAQSGIPQTTTPLEVAYRYARYQAPGVFATMDQVASFVQGRFVAATNNTPQSVTPDRIGDVIAQAMNGPGL